MDIYNARIQFAAIRLERRRKTQRVGRAVARELFAVPVQAVAESI
jgi:hypothetical protein